MEEIISVKNKKEFENCDDPILKTFFLFGTIGNLSESVESTKNLMFFFRKAKKFNTALDDLLSLSLWR